MKISEYLLGAVLDQKTDPGRCVVHFESLHGVAHGLAPYTTNLPLHAPDNRCPVTITDTRPGAPVEWLYYVDADGKEQSFIATPAWHTPEAA